MQSIVCNNKLLQDINEIISISYLRTITDDGIKKEFFSTKTINFVQKFSQF